MTKSEMENRMRAVCATMKRDLDTEQAYISTLRRFFDFIGARQDLRVASPVDRVRAYLEHIAPDVSQSTQDGAKWALLFFHRHVLGRPLPKLGGWAKAKRAVTIPNWLPHEDVMRVIEAMRGEKKLQAEICYGSGCRIEDVATLRIKGVDLENRRLIIHQGKGRKDRVTVLSRAVVDPLRRQIEYARTLWKSDRQRGRPGVALPLTLENSRASWGEEWAWFWVFPSERESICPRSGIQRRHHVHKDCFSKALAAAGRKVGLSRRLNAHALRHSFATTYLDRGGSIHKLSAMLGHKDIRTTARYLHCTKDFTDEVTSPLDEDARNVVAFPSSTPPATTHLHALP